MQWIRVNWLRSPGIVDLRESDESFLAVFHDDYVVAPLRQIRRVKAIIAEGNIDRAARIHNAAGMIEIRPGHSIDNHNLAAAVSPRCCVVPSVRTDHV